MRRRLLGAIGGLTLLVAAAGCTADEPGPVPDPAMTPGPVPVIDQVEQLTPAGRREGVVPPGVNRICDPGAGRIRLRFSALDLREGESVTLSGSGGESYTLVARNWPGKGFYTRSLAGDCVTVTSSLSGGTFTVDAWQSIPADATVVVAGAGDLCGTACDQTADLIASIDPTAVFTVGDNAYRSGTLAEFNTGYSPTWGRFKDKTRPVPGNHEYATPSASGYFDYFNGTGKDTGIAGERGKGYYSWDTGDWHFVAVNSDIDHAAGSAQLDWLAADLAASTKPCTAAYTHHPRYSSGEHGDDPGMAPLVSILAGGATDVLIQGHDHDYERFAPVSASGHVDTTGGLRTFVIGTGGAELYTPRTTTAGPSEAFSDDTFGVGKFELSRTGYTFDFVPVAGKTFTDHVTGGCHKAGPAAGASAPPGGSSGSAPRDVAVSAGVAGYRRSRATDRR